MKVVINACYGGYRLSDEACHLLYARGLDEDVERHNHHLVEIVERLGPQANGLYSELKIIQIPDSVKDYRVMDYDGVEWIAEPHRTWQ